MDLEMVTTLYSRGVTVTASDTVALPFLPNGLYVGGGSAPSTPGNVAVKWPDGTSSTFVAVPIGSFLPIRPAYVLAAGTTATSILAVA